MKKKPYRAVDVKEVDVKKLGEQVRGREVVIGVDVGKEQMYASVRDRGEEVRVTVKWRHPWETAEAVKRLAGLPGAKVEVAMEPSGTYGDSVREAFRQAGVKVYRVGAKRSHDAAEVYDGVPSLHDGKSCAIIAQLHGEGVSREWEPASEGDRELGAAGGVMTMYEGMYRQGINRLEAQLGRHWPELGEVLGLGTVTMLVLLMRYPGPQEVGGAGEKAAELMRRTGGGLLKEETIQAVVSTARQTVGVAMVEAEKEAMRVLVREVWRAQRKAKKAKEKVAGLGEREEGVKAQAEVVGRATAAVLRHAVGDAREYPSAEGYVKGMGLNLKVKSSGMKKGQLKITKRGPGIARKYLYYAVMRLIQSDEVIGAWYARKVARDGGAKGWAMVAVMRKLAQGLWHVGRGAVFDSRKLFDVKRLGLCE